MAELLRLAAPIPGQNWLELGCGTGEFTRTIWEMSRGKLAELVSLDDRVEAFENFRSALEGCAFPYEDRARFLCCDYRVDLSPFQSKHFNRVIGGPRLLDGDRVGRLNLAEIKRVLRCGGLFVLAIRANDSLMGSIRSAGFERMETFPIPNSDVQLLRAWKVTEHGDI